MNHTDSAVASDAEPDQHSASWEVLLDKIWGSIQGINPDDRIFGVECLEVFTLNLSLRVGFAQGAIDEATTFLVGVIQLLRWEEVLYLFCYLGGVDSWLLILDWLCRLFALDA